MRLYDAELQEAVMYLLLAQNDATQTPTTGSTPSDATGRLAELKVETLDFIQANGVEFAINLLIAGVIYYIGRIAAHMITGIVRRGLQRAKVDAMLVSFLANILYAVLLVVVVMAALN